jgi:hypothetical protein
MIFFIVIKIPQHFGAAFGDLMILPRRTTQLPDQESPLRNREASSQHRRGANVCVTDKSEFTEAASDLSS